MSEYNTTAEDREGLKDVFSYDTSALFLNVHFLARRSVLDLLKDFDRLQAIVDKLPLTKDGVRALPPIKLWHPGNGDGHILEAHLLGIIVSGETVVWECYGKRLDGSTFETCVQCCYFSRDAAEAAEVEFEKL